MEIVTKPIGKEALKAILPGFFGDMVKAVVDVSQGIVGIDAELHADIEQELLKQGCKQENLWGINLYPEMAEDEFVEFDALINIRPCQGNRGRDISDPVVKEKVLEIVAYLFQ